MLDGFLPMLVTNQATVNSDVHCGQRVALAGMLMVHRGQFLVDGGAGAGAGFLKRLACFTNTKIANATIRKLITVFKKAP